MRPSLKRKLLFILPALTVAWVLLMLISLRFGLLNIFSYSSFEYHIMGVDFFGLPKAYLNLLEQRSMYDTWGGVPYGLYRTWYVYHPAFGFFVGFWFSFFRPMASYWLFVLLSIALLALSARVIARNTEDPLLKRACYFLILVSFPAFWVLYSGNIHAFSVLSFALILSALFSLTYHEDEGAARSANLQLLAGLLISLFTKPLALLFMPLLLINERTRRTAIISLAIYVAVSAIFILAPALNPEPIRPGEIMRLALDPKFVKENMNIYKNNYKLNAYMKDNSVHWFYIVASEGHYWNHVEILSLPSFVNTLFGKILPGTIFKVPLLLSLLLSIMAAAVKGRKERGELSILLIMALTLSFFLSYNIIWEYQFALLLPAVALLVLLLEKRAFFYKWIPLLLAISSFFYLPTLYFIFRGRTVDSLTMTLIRLDKVVPALLLFLILMAIAAAEMVKAFSSRSSPS